LLGFVARMKQWTTRILVKKYLKDKITDST